MAGSCSGVVVVGTGEAALVARAVGAVHSTRPDSLATLPAAWLVWGPIDLVHQLHVHRRGRRVAWRVAGLDLPLSRRDHRLLADIDKIVVPDAETLASLDGQRTRCEVIGPLPVTCTTRAAAAGEPATSSAAILAADATSVGTTLVSLKQLLDGGLVRCGSCGRTAAAAFDPSRLAFAAPEPCRCGGDKAALDAPPARWVVAIRGEDDAGATAMAAWLGIGDRVAIVSEAALEVRGVDLVVDTSTGVDPGWGTGLAAAAGVRSITAATRRGAGTVVVRTRTEPDADGRVRHTIDPVDLHRVVTDQLRVRSGGPIGGTPVADRCGSETTEVEIVRAWTRLLHELTVMEPPRVPARRLRSLTSPRMRS